MYVQMAINEASMAGKESACVRGTAPAVSGHAQEVAQRWRRHLLKRHFSELHSRLKTWSSNVCNPRIVQMFDMYVYDCMHSYSPR